MVMMILLTENNLGKYNLGALNFSGRFLWAGKNDYLCEDVKII
jgi:hypothetical protein